MTSNRASSTHGFIIPLFTAGMFLCALLSPVLLFELAFPQVSFSYALLCLSLLLSLGLCLGLRPFRRKRFLDLFFHLLGAGALIILVSWEFLRAAEIPWFPFSSTAVFILIFWGCGIVIGYGREDYLSTVNRFDIGLGGLIILGFFKTAAGSFSPADPYLGLGYLLFGILALYSARNRSTDPDFKVSSSPLRFLLPLTIFLLSAGALFLLLYPVITKTANTAYRALKAGVVPLIELLKAIIRFLMRMNRLAPGALDSASPAVPPEDALPRGELSPFFLLLQKILVWVSIAVLIGVALLVIYLFILKLLRFLSKSSGSSGSNRLILRDLFTRLILFFRSILRLFKKKNRSPGKEAFHILSSWGRGSGIRRRRDETVCEYAERLIKAFPMADRPVTLLLQSIHQEWYQEKSLSSEQRRKLRQARLQLLSPALYKSRLRFLLLRR